MERLRPARQRHEHADSNVPVPVSNLTGVVAIAAGGHNWCAGGHSLALKSDGTVWAWGSNYYGQLGNGTNTDSNVPVPVSNLTGVVAIAAGGSHSLALKSDGTVWAWGSNDYGQIGNASARGATNVPLPVVNLAGVVAIAAGGTPQSGAEERRHGVGVGVQRIW